jgi:chemotaxis protein CheC
MSVDSENFDKELQRLLELMAREGAQNAARGLSGMVGEPLTVSEPRVRLVPLSEISALLGGPENEAVGIYLRVEGEIAGQMMMVIPYPRALELSDMLLCVPAGTTTCLGRLERSALAELGNLAGSFFLNAINAATGIGARPSPPAVMVDMIGAILDVILAMSEGLSESVLMVEATFSRKGLGAQANFWLIPDRGTLEAIVGRDLARNA